ncbi:MAG: ABC-F family ATP-binding cassette domain-containing protein [Xanthomonadaceae bacterium]|jgi:ATP-binding cassette subfamily F protein 3|nr:ABC-F family ATP-binding cassette domain-containing protein [Xanthomonadaceae bacterium]
MISFRTFALRRGERLLLSDVDLTLYDGYRVGVVGRNGTGKSSLFAVIRGELEPDRGDIELSGKIRVADVAQETPALPAPALNFVLSGDTAVAAALELEARALEQEDWETVAIAHQQLEEYGGYDARARAGRLLHGLGFPADTHECPVAEFSGGWRVRLNLARALMTPSDLLLLDEPTNHLDLDAVLWLEQWLLKYPGMLLLISHDREFLDNVATHTLHLRDGGAQLYSGGYTDFERQRAEQLRQQQIAHEKELAERAHLQSFIDRFKAKASKAKQAQSRIKRLAKLSGTEAVRVERQLRIEFGQPQKLPHSLLRLRHADAGYGERRVLHQVDFGLEAGDRIGLLGPNGAGKSTLVKTLVGELPLLSGERNAHPDLRIGYFAQHTLESLQEGQSPLDHLREQSPDTPTQALRDFLGRWSFPGDRAFESVDGFSGGERARLALALVAWRQPNVLLLDEPTNHLDLEMRESLAEALADFDGAIVMVSHDRHLIGLVCDTYWRVANGGVSSFDGDLDAYAAWLRTYALKEGETKPAPPVPLASNDKRLVARKVPNPYKLARAEAEVADAEARLTEVDAKLADPAVFADEVKVAELMHMRDALYQQLQAAEHAWAALYDSAG